MIHDLALANNETKLQLEDQPINSAIPPAETLDSGQEVVSVVGGGDLAGVAH